MFANFVNTGLRRNALLGMRFCTANTSAPTNIVKEASVLIPPEIEAVFSLQNASRKQVLQQRVAAAKDQFKTHKTDTGSPQVQIAILTERIGSLAVHFATHKKDKKGYRGFEAIVNKRKRMMRYLRQYNPEVYIHTVNTLGLQREAQLLKSGKGDKHGQKYFKNI